MKRLICIRGIAPIKLVHGNGQIVQLKPPVTVLDVVKAFPHHFVLQMSAHTSTDHSEMLPLDFELEPGGVYFLIRVPRLFPSKDDPFRPSCSCYSNHNRGQHNLQVKHFHAISPLRLKHILSSVVSPRRSPSRRKKVSPELRSLAVSANPYSNPYGSGVGSNTKSFCFPGSSPVWSPRFCRSPSRSGEYRMQLAPGKWRPELRIISEDEALATAIDENLLWYDGLVTGNSHDQRGSSSPLKSSRKTQDRSTFGALTTIGSPVKVSSPTSTSVRIGFGSWSITMI